MKKTAPEKDKVGTPWKVVAIYGEFAEADEHRRKLLDDKKPAKVLSKTKGGKRVFQVRTR